MSFAIHLFMAEKFSEESYRRFLGNAQNLYGKWNLEESVPFNEDPRYLTIQECWINSGDVPSHEWFRVNVKASKHLKDVFMWDFDYEWHLRLETSAGRSPLGLAVQLRAWLLAIDSFQFILAIDRDSYIKDEPTEFRSKEAVVEHIKRVFDVELPECSVELKQRGILDENGRFLT